MTIEQEWEKYRNHKHLIGTLPKSAYVRIMLYGLALQEQMERTLKELGSVPSARPALSRARIAQDAKRKRSREIGHAKEIAVSGAKLEAERRTA